MCCFTLTSKVQRQQTMVLCLYTGSIKVVFPFSIENVNIIMMIACQMTDRDDCDIFACYILAFTFIAHLCTCKQLLLLLISVHVL